LILPSFAHILSPRTSMPGRPFTETQASTFTPTLAIPALTPSIRHVCL
jgi:hypothetical protein